MKKDEFNQIKKTTEDKEEATKIVYLEWCKLRKFNYLKHDDIEQQSKFYASAVKDNSIKALLLKQSKTNLQQY